MANTVTAFYSFSPGTKARSSEVNTNFSQFRGTIVPVVPDTATSADNTYDLGSSEYYWQRGYFGGTVFRGVTTASYVTEINDQSTVGGMAWLIGATPLTLGVMKLGTFGFAGPTTTEFLQFQFQTTGSGGPIDLLLGGTTISTWDNNGLKANSVQPIASTSSAADVGQAIVTGVTSAVWSLNTTGTITLYTGRITTKGNGVVWFECHGGKIHMANTTSTGIRIDLLRGSTTTSLSTITSFNHFNSASIGIQREFGFKYFDVGYTSGETVYRLNITISQMTNTSSFTITSAFFIKEL